MGAPYSPPEKPMPLTVGALVNTLNDLVRDGNLTPESKVCVFVNDAQGHTGSEVLHETVTIVGWGKYICLSPCRAVVLEQPKTMEEFHESRKAILSESTVKPGGQG